MAFKFTGLNSLGDGQRRGAKKNRSNSGLEWETMSSDQFGITKIHHTRRTKINLFWFKASPSPVTSVSWMTTMAGRAETLQRLRTLSWHCRFKYARQLLWFNKPTTKLNQFQMLLKIFNWETNNEADMEPSRARAIPRMSHLNFD